MSISSAVSDVAKRPSLLVGEVMTLLGLSGAPGNGPFYECRLQVSSGIIVASSFRCHDCFWATTIGSATAVVLRGRGLSEGQGIHPSDIIGVLGEAPPMGNRDLLDLICASVRSAASGSSCVSNDASTVKARADQVR